MARLLLALALLFSLIWAGFVAQDAWLNWPHVSLDLSAKDPATQAAHDQAIMMHVARYAAIALAPLITVGVVAGLVRRSGSRRVD